MKKIWKDTTTNPATGKYSQKRLMMWGWFWMSMFLGFTNAVTIKTDPKFDIDTRPVDEMLIVVFICAALGATAAAILGFYSNRKTADGNGQPLKPAFEDCDFEKENKEEQI